MKYVRLEKGVVAEIIPEFNPLFPNVSVAERYPKEFVKKLVETADETAVYVGMVRQEDGTYTVPAAIMPDKYDSLDDAKCAKIAESKTKLAEWLHKNPMLYSDGKYYAVSAEKQNLLNSNLTSFERAEQAGIDYPLKWNATGEECVEWEYADLVGLSLAIAAYVAPQVARQQAVEIEIKACKTAEELAEVVIYYGN